jgi:hypothetical protein
MDWFFAGRLRDVEAVVWEVTAIGCYSTFT